MKQQYEEQFLEAWEVPPRKGWKYKVCVVLGLLAACAVIASFQSCNTPKRAARIFDNHPKDAAKYCGDRYKPTEKVTTRIQYKPGKPYPVPGETQYVTVDCDSVNKAALRNSEVRSKIVKVPIPTYLQVDTAAITTDIERENVAKLAYKDAVIDSIKAAYQKQSVVKESLTTENSKLTKQRNSGWYAFSILLLIDIVILWLMKKGIIR